MTVNPPAAGTFVPTGSEHTRFDRNSSASAGADANSSSTIAPLNRVRSLLLITLSFFLEAWRSLDGRAERVIGCLIARVHRQRARGQALPVCVNITHRSCAGTSESPRRGARLLPPEKLECCLDVAALSCGAILISLATRCQGSARSRTGGPRCAAGG